MSDFGLITLEILFHFNLTNILFPFSFILCTCTSEIITSVNIVRCIHPGFTQLSDMDTFLADASQKLITKLGTLLVFNEVYDVRGKQEKTVGKAEGNIRRYAERFCDQEQLTLHHHVTNSDIGLCLYCSLY